MKILSYGFSIIIELYEHILIKITFKSVIYDGRIVIGWLPDDPSDVA